MAREEKDRSLLPCLDLRLYVECRYAKRTQLEELEIHVVRRDHL